MTDAPDRSGVPDPDATLSETPNPADTCPYLGLRSDSATAALYPHPGHACYRVDRPAAIATDHQAAFCLTADHARCPVFAGQAAAPPAPPPVRWVFDRRTVLALLLFVVVIPALMGTTVALLVNGDDDDGGRTVAGAPPSDVDDDTDATDPADDVAVGSPSDGADDPADPADGVPSDDPESALAELEAWPNMLEWTVKPGDSLFAVAREFGTTVEALAVRNGLDDVNAIFEGQVLQVPVGFTTPLGVLDEEDILGAGGGLADASPENGADEDGEDASGDDPPEGDDDSAATPDSPPDGEPEAPPEGTPLDPDALAELRAWPTLVDHIVAEGESLFGISLEYDTTPDAILVYNDLTSDVILPGQPLVIPVGFSRSLVG